MRSGRVMSVALAFGVLAMLGEGVCAAQVDLRALVQRNVPALSSENPEAARTARKNLLEPLAGDGVSVRTRLDYWRELRADLSRLSQDEDETLAVDALLLAGEVATADSTELLISRLNDPRSGVRFASAMGLKRTFVSIARAAPALDERATDRALAALEASAKGETDPLVVDGIMQALGKGALVPEARVPGVRAGSIDAILRVMEARLARPTEVDETMRPALTRAAQAMRLAMTDAAVQASDPASPAQLKKAGAFAGDLLRYAVWRLRDDPPASDSRARSELESIANGAEIIYFFAHSRLDPGASPLRLRLDQSVRDAKDDAFERDALQLIGPDGVLTGPTFGLPDDRFAIPR